MYYLTFLNIKIKDYYYFAYYLWYYYYYILYVSYYIIYLIIYKERTKANRKGRGKRKRNRRERGTGQRMPPPSSPVPRLSSVPSAVLTVRTIATTSPPFTQPGQRGQGFGLSVILPPLACVLLPAASFRLPRSPLFVLISSARSCLTFRPPLPARLVGGEGRAGHQPGQAIPSRSSCRPSPPCRGASAYCQPIPGRRAGGRRFRAAGLIRATQSFRGNRREQIALNINYLYSPVGRKKTR